MGKLITIYKLYHFYRSREGRTPTGLIPNGFSYHYKFPCLFSLWSGLYLHHTFQFRCSPSSLYTFKISLAWLGIAILQVSPNLRSYIYKVSFIKLNFLSPVRLPISPYSQVKVLHNLKD